MVPQAEKGRRDASISRPAGSEPKGLGFRWLLIITVTILVLTIVLPLVTQQRLRVDFNATSESSDQWEEIDEAVLPGAEQEAFLKTVSTEYKAIFMPLQLTDRSSHFTGIMVFFGPVMITGQPLELNGAPDSETSDLRSIALIRLASAAGPIVFFILLILLLAVMDLLIKDTGAILKFVITLSLFWLGYSLIMWLIGGWMMVPVNDIFEGMLTEEQGSADYHLDFMMSVLGPPVRIFFVGILYWVFSYMLRKARSEPPNEDFAAAKSLRA
jgi:hypothetical protein